MSKELRLRDDTAFKEFKVAALGFVFHKLSYVWTILGCFIFFVFWFVFIFGWFFLIIEFQLKWTLELFKYPSKL